jgi:uncharacterized protein YdcH (DUF465 family)
VPLEERPMDEQEIKARLVAENDEFRAIFEQHQAYEQELNRFQNKTFLTEKETLSMKEIKHKKLVLKDKMYRMMNDFRKSLI